MLPNEGDEVEAADRVDKADAPRRWGADPAAGRRRDRNGGWRCSPVPAIVFRCDRPLLQISVGLSERFRPGRSVKRRPQLLQPRA